MPVTEQIPPHEQYILNVLLLCSSTSMVPKDRNALTPTPSGVLPCSPGDKGEPLVVPVLLSTIEAISSLRLHMPKDLRSLQARETLWKGVREVVKRFPQGISLLDPIKDMDVKDEKFMQLLKVRTFLTSSSTNSHACCRKLR